MSGLLSLSSTEMLLPETKNKKYISSCTATALHILPALWLAHTLQPQNGNFRNRFKKVKTKMFSLSLKRFEREKCRNIYAAVTCTINCYIATVGDERLFWSLKLAIQRLKKCSAQSGCITGWYQHNTNVYCR